MRPKAKNKKAKGKIATVPEIDPNEIVTELMKQFFEFQLNDIDKKITLINERKLELKNDITGLDNKIEEFRREKGIIIREQEALLAETEKEKIKRREEMLWLTKEIKIRLENYKKRVEELEIKYTMILDELTSELEEVREEVRILEEFKQNRDLYSDQLVELEMQIEEMEMQHQRDLFEINRNWEMAKVKVKKELETKLLNLSIEFQQISKKKLGNSCHRVTQENKAIQYELRQMREELLEYQEKLEIAKTNLNAYKNHMGAKKTEKEKSIARTVIQSVVIKALLKGSLKILGKLEAFAADEAENRTLLRKFKLLEFEIEGKLNKIENIKHSIEKEIEEIKFMREASNHLKRSMRKLHILSRHSLQIAEEAKAVLLIPFGGMEEEKYLNIDAKIQLFKRRRDSVFEKRGRILQYLFEFLQKAKMSEENIQILRESSLDVDAINFAQIYGKSIQDVERKESAMASLPEEPKLALSGSDISLPRSISEEAIVLHKTESESFEGEYEEDDTEMTEKEKEQMMISFAEIEKKDENLEDDWEENNEEVEKPESKEFIPN